MDFDVIFILLILLAFLLIISIPIGLSIFIYKWLKKRGFKKIASFISALIIGLFSYSIFSAIYPPDSFYIDEFEENTKLVFPKSGKIILKDADFPDHFGDYWATAVVVVSENDFNILFHDLKANKDFKLDTSKFGIGIGTDFEKLIQGSFKESDIKIILANQTKEWFKVAFLKDGTTIIFERSSS